MFPRSSWSSDCCVGRDRKRPEDCVDLSEFFRYIFGGLVRESARNDLYLFSTRDQSATLLQTAGDGPSPRVGHASALVSSVLIVWGGDTKTDPKSKPTDKQDDNLYLLNLGLCVSPCR